ncbi:MAG TPA: hypothetical protein VNA20_02945 [Frankiaceae bacterium]|nr:hypothetical protein [Frankiaceae bacterium]
MLGHRRAGCRFAEVNRRPGGDCLFEQHGGRRVRVGVDVGEVVLELVRQPARGLGITDDEVDADGSAVELLGVQVDRDGATSASCGLPWCSARSASRLSVEDTPAEILAGGHRPLGMVAVEQVPM